MVRFISECHFFGMIGAFAILIVSSIIMGIAWGDRDKEYDDGNYVGSDEYFAYKKTEAYDFVSTVRSVSGVLLFVLVFLFFLLKEISR